MMKGKYGPQVPEKTYVPHAYPEQLFDTGEVLLNYATAGSAERPALVLIPGQTESWWGYEAAIGLLKDHFQPYAVDLRGQGRSGRTPGAIHWITSGGSGSFHRVSHSAAGDCQRSLLWRVIAAWFSAYAPPGVLRGAHSKDQSRVRALSGVVAHGRRMMVRLFLKNPYAVLLGRAGGLKGGPHVRRN
jgi:hypothetical protein